MNTLQGIGLTLESNEPRPTAGGTAPEFLEILHVTECHVAAAFMWSPLDSRRFEHQSRIKSGGE
jgi:hypothetical protein